MQRGSKPSGPAAVAQGGHRRDLPVVLGAEWTRGGLADHAQAEGAMKEPGPKALEFTEKAAAPHGQPPSGLLGPATCSL